MNTYITAPHTLYVHEGKDPGPGAVHHVAGSQPHERYEGEEVAMVAVAHAVEHPGWRAREGQGTASLLEPRFKISLTYSHHHKPQVTAREMSRLYYCCTTEGSTMLYACMCIQ